MNLGSLNEYSTEAELCRVTLHEFGHALGCIHEHQSPAADILWDEPVVIKAAHDKWHWDEDRTRDQILRKRVGATQHSKFDPKSIMCYIVPAEWTLNKQSINRNLALSETDISYICKLYPFRTHNSGRLSIDPDIRKPYPAPLSPDGFRRDTTTIHFPNNKTYPLPPGILIWLNGLDMDSSHNWRIRARAQNITPTTFDLVIESWSDTVLYSASVARVAYPADYPGV
jgi:hypothetical protein